MSIGFSSINGWQAGAVGQVRSSLAAALQDAFDALDQAGNGTSIIIAAPSSTLCVATANGPVGAGGTPAADFTSSVAGLSVTFADASTNSGGTNSSWAWAFGDGTTSSAQNPVHAYSTSGDYTVSLTVTDSANGQTSTKTKTVTVAQGGGGAGSSEFQYLRGLGVIKPSYPPAYPPAGGTWADPTTGATIERVTDRATVAGPDSLEIVYSRYTPESNDGKYLLVHGLNSTSSYILDRTTRALVRTMTNASGKSIGEVNELRWSYDASEPSVLYYVDGMKFCKQDIETGANTTIRDFSADFPGANLVMNDVEGDSSHDSRYWHWMAMTVPSTGAYYPIAFFTYDKQANAILGTMTFANWGLANGDTTPAGRMPRPNMVEISPDGQWAMIHWNRCWGTGTDPNTAANGNLAGTHADGPHCYPLDLNVAGAVKVSVDATHSAWAMNAAGAWVFVSQNNRTDWIEAVNPADGTTVQMITQGVLGWNGGWHFAGAAGMPGWALLSTYSATNNDPGENQLIFLPIKANSNPLRLSPTYSLHTGVSQDSYFQEAYAAITSDARRVYWAGNFGDTAKVDVYRIEMPANWTAQVVP